MKWNETTLSQICISSAFGPRFSSDLYSIDGNIATLRTTDISQDGEINYATMPLAQIDINNFSNHYLETNDIVITRSGTIGIVALFKSNPLPVLPGAFLLRFRLASSVYPLFYKYYFHSPVGKGSILATATGAVQQNLNITNLNKVTVPVPPLPTQLKIATILSAYDDLIENNLKRIKLLEETININYKNLISTEDKNFTNEKLNSFVDIISGFPFKSNYYNENGKHKIVTIKNVQDGFFVPVVTDRIDDIPDNINKALFLSTGDVIMSLTGNVGRVCLVYGDDYVLNQRVVKLSAKELIDQSFIYALVRDKQMLIILENLSNGTAQQNLSPIKMGELLIRYPSSNLRESFDKKVSPMIEMICKLNTQNTKLREARDILLPKLMNGQIEV